MRARFLLMVMGQTRPDKLEIPKETANNGLLKQIMAK